MNPASASAPLKNGEWSVSNSTDVATSAARSRWASGRTARSSAQTTYELGTTVHAGSASAADGTVLVIGRRRSIAYAARPGALRWKKYRPASADGRTTPSSPGRMHAWNSGNCQRDVWAPEIGRASWRERG